MNPNPPIPAHAGAAGTVAAAPALILPLGSLGEVALFWQLCLLICALPLGLVLLARVLRSRPSSAASTPNATIGRASGPAAASAAGACPASASAASAAGGGASAAPVGAPPTGGSATGRARPARGHATLPSVATVSASGSPGGHEPDPEDAPEAHPPAENTLPDPEPLPLHENPSPQPGPESFLGGNRPTWEQFAFYARQRRVDTARGREMVRNALGALADDGFFVFEDVLTVQDGAIDQLVVGPTGVHPVVVMAHRGYVHCDPDTRSLMWGRIKRDPGLPDHESRYWHGFWEESPHQVMHAFRKSLADEVAHRGVGGMSIFCFTEATLVRDPDGRLPAQTATPFDLAQTLRDTDPEAYGYPRLDAAHVRELARLVVQNYKRLPWVVPPEHAQFAALLEAEL